MRFNLSIGQRTALGFALLVLLVMGATIAGLFFTNTVEDTVNSTRNGVTQTQAIGNLETSWLAVVSTIDNMLLTRQTGLIEQRLVGELADFNDQLQALDATVLGQQSELSDENAAIVQTLQSLGGELSATVNLVTEQALAGSWARAQTLRHTDLASLQRRLNTSLDQLSTNIERDVEASVQESVDAQETTRNYWIAIAIVAAVIGIVAAWLTVRSITRPVASLVNTTVAIEQGDLSRRAQVTSEDEIGTLARSFNSMADQLNDMIDHLEDRVSARTRDLQIASDVSRQITTVLDIDILLQQVAMLTAQSYKLYASFIFLPSEDGSFLYRAAGSDIEGELLHPQGLDQIPVTARPSVIALAARTRREVLINDVSESPDYRSVNTLPNTRSELAIPMLLGGQLLGIFDLQSSEVNRFSPDDLRVLKSLAEQIAIATRNAQLFAQTEAARDAAEEANRVKSQFLANMSHELRTPLNAILNFTGFIADGILGPVNGQQLDSLNKVMASGQHLLSLINDILDLTKIEVGMMDLFIEEVDLNAALEAVVSTAKGLVKDKPIRLYTEIQEDLPPIKGDRRRVRQIMLNLVANAVKFTPEGSVTIIAQEQGDEIYMAVRDTGVGIPEDQQDMVFETFRQAKHELAETPGTGLGLPITKHFVEAHGGRIWMDSRIGIGTTFHVLLPIHAPELDSEPALSSGTVVASE